MNEKEYRLPDGRKITFPYDENRIGKVSLEAMDALMEMIINLMKDQANRNR